jgi:hypothetical protein
MNCEFNFVYTFSVTNIELGNNSDGQHSLTHLITHFEEVLTI